eukprot:3698847-Pyramimonas_sp.AAC.1
MGGNDYSEYASDVVHWIVRSRAAIILARCIGRYENHVGGCQPAATARRWSCGSRVCLETRSWGSAVIDRFPTRLFEEACCRGSPEMQICTQPPGWRSRARHHHHRQHDSDRSAPRSVAATSPHCIACRTLPAHQRAAACAA